MDTPEQRDFDLSIEGWVFANRQTLRSRIKVGQKAYERIGFEDTRRKQTLQIMREIASDMKE